MSFLVYFPCPSLALFFIAIPSGRLSGSEHKVGSFPQVYVVGSCQCPSSYTMRLWSTLSCPRTISLLCCPAIHVFARVIFGNSCAISTACSTSQSSLGVLFTPSYIASAPQRWKTRMCFLHLLRMVRIKGSFVILRLTTRTGIFRSGTKTWNSSVRAHMVKFGKAAGGWLLNTSMTSEMGVIVVIAICLPPDNSDSLDSIRELKSSPFVDAEEYILDFSLG